MHCLNAGLPVQLEATHNIFSEAKSIRKKQNSQLKSVLTFDGNIANMQIKNIFTIIITLISVKQFQN